MRERLCLLDDPERELLVADAPDGLAGFIDVHVQRVVESDAVRRGRRPRRRGAAPRRRPGGRPARRGRGLVAGARPRAPLDPRQPGPRRPARVLRGRRLPRRQGPARLRVPAVKRIVLGDCLDVLQGLDDGCARLVYLDPPFNTGKVQERTRLRTVRDADGDRTGLQGRALPHRGAGQRRLERRLRRLPGVPRAAPRGGAARPHPRRLAVLPHRPARGALLQGAARRAVRPRVVPQRDRLGLRLRRPPAHALAGQARHHLLVRARPVALRLPLRRHRPRALPGARPGRPGEGRARQDADRRLVADHREPHGQGEDRLPDAEAAQDPRAHRRACTRTRATSSSTPSPAAAPPARRPRGWAATTCWWTRTPRRSA